MGQQIAQKMAALLQMEDQHQQNRELASFHSMPMISGGGFYTMEPVKGIPALERPGSEKNRGQPLIS